MNRAKEQGKHTLGPWLRQHYTIKDVRGRVLAKCNIEHNDENEANARLIGAAPELLEALKQLSKWCDNNVNGVPSELGRIQSLADAAIAKAEGC